MKAGDEVNLLWQVAEAPIGWKEITHEARHLQARYYGDSTAPNLQHSLTTVSTATLGVYSITGVWYSTHCEGGVDVLVLQCCVLVLTVKAGSSGWLNFVLKEWTRRRRSTSMNDRSPDTKRRSLNKLKAAATRREAEYSVGTVVVVAVDSDSLRQRPIERLGLVVVLRSQRALQPLAGVEAPRAGALPQLVKAAQAGAIGHAYTERLPVGEGAELPVVTAGDHLHVTWET